jgi:hypothetical protein
VNLALNDTDGTLVDAGLAELLYISLDKSLAAVDSQGLGETVAAHRNDSNLNFRYVLHIRINNLKK